MPRHIRNNGHTGWAHIIVRGINRENLFYDEEDYRRFVSTIARFRREVKYELAAYCLMSNHIHMLLFVEDGNFSGIIKKLLVSYAAYYNKKYERVGHVFQDRYLSEPINDERYLLTVVRYIYRNPEKAGICCARDYPYTYIETNGVLSGYFLTADELTAFLDADSEDSCLDYDTRSGYDDSEALKLLCAIIGNGNPQSLQELKREQRDSILHQLKAQGLSVRQISRLTGINRNIIQRS